MTEDVVRCGRVELLIYSGRPNPTWWLEWEEWHALWGILRQLRYVSEAAGMPGGLGYRGFSLSEMSASPIWQWPEAHVLADKVGVRAGKVWGHVADPDHLAEKFLLDLVRPRLAPTLFDSILAETKE